MGSIGSFSHEAPPQSGDQNPSHDNYRIYTSFSGKHPTPNANISNWIECYDPSNDTTHRVTTIPSLIENHVLKGFAMVSIGREYIYVIGGRLCHKEVVVNSRDRPHDDIFEMDLEVRQAVLKYNIRTGIWSKCASLGVPRFDFACTVIEDKIYVAGGKSTVGSARGISSAEVYDPALDQWKPLPNLSTSRYKCVGVTWQEKFYVVGGFAEKADDHNDNKLGPYIMERSSAEVYNTRNTTWEYIPRMWDLDVPPNQIVAVGGRLFSSGDCFKKWKGHIEAYDGEQNIWNEVNGSHLDTLASPVSTLDATTSTSDHWPPTEQTYLTMAPVGTRLLFLAGFRTAGDIPRFRSEVHVFDTSECGWDGWRSFHPVEEEGEKELCCHCCVLKHAS